ncbi:MAG: alpha/beta hydrolase [Planctomycetes bacterium]|nr:alpha/beta hydrolase [Planctomycetota bacterium]MCB9936320.1 alpha/beta hydrolase [Planctomycetota bacterium]
MKKLAWLILPALLLAYAPVQAQQAEKKDFPARNAKATAPDRQPEDGPGGGKYAHAKVETHEALEAGEHYWLYTPAEPVPEKAPVIAFIHGYGQLNPEGYDAWLEHLCRRGNIVIYPQYQAHGLEPPANYAPNCATSILDAFKYLEADKTRVQPIKEKFAIAGHSAGGVTTANLAADWESLKLPKPKAVMPVQPGRAFSCNCEAQKNGLIPLSDFAGIPEEALLLSVFSDSDHTVGAWCAKEFFVKATKVKAENKNLVEFISSDYGKKSIVATHQTPAAPATRAEMLDVWDWYGYWKLLDGLTDAAFHGKNREYALGDTPQQKDMGSYSDGRPFEKLKVWKGDAEINPDEEYKPVFDRNGNRNQKPPEPKEAEPKKEKPAETPGRKEDKEEEEEF